MFEPLAKSAMGILLLASVPSDGTPELWANWGLAGLVVGYTLYRDWQRERRMSEAIEKHETWVRETLIGALERNSAALEKFGTHLKSEGER